MGKGMRGARGRTMNYGRSIKKRDDNDEEGKGMDEERGQC